jgi:hypothetical protein
VRFHGDQLLVDAEGCPSAGRLADSPACRETVIGALSERDVAGVYVRVEDTERACARDVAAFLLAAGRFAALCSPHDADLAARARRDPLGAARLAAGRADATARIAAETGFIEGSVRSASYRAAFGDAESCEDAQSRGDSGDLADGDTRAADEQVGEHRR